MSHEAFNVVMSLQLRMMARASQAALRWAVPTKRSTAKQGKAPPARAETSACAAYVASDAVGQ